MAAFLVFGNLPTQKTYLKNTILTSSQAED